MNCPHCNNLIDESYHYCPKCGYNLKVFFADDNALFEAGQKLLTQCRYKEAIPYFKRAARLGNDKAMYVYGLQYLNGTGVEKSYKNLLYCMVKSAERKNDEALIFLIDTFINGKYGQEKNDDKAYELYLNLSESAKEKHSDLHTLFNDDNDAVSDVQAIGKVLEVNGEINNVVFETPVISDLNKKDPFVEEQEKLIFFYKTMAVVIDKCNKSLLPWESVAYYDREDWEVEVEKRENNLRTQERINLLQNALDEPYIGRMILKYNKDSTHIRDIYVGKNSISDGNNILVHSWYSPVGNKIYDDYNSSWDVDENHIELLLKRAIKISSRQLVNVYETFSADNKDKVIADEYLISRLKDKRTIGRLSDIIASIQYNQNQIIISDINRNMIMQGCAGCGKTMILFHRLKYILGNSIMLKNKISILTPNEKFNDYVKPLLRDLEIFDVEVLSIAQYYVKIIDAYFNDYYLHSKDKKSKFNKERFVRLFYANNRISATAVVLADDSTLPANVVEYYYSDEFFESVDSLKTITVNPITDKNLSQNKNGIDEIDIIEMMLGEKEKQLLPRYDRRAGVIHRCELFALCLFLYKRCGNNSYTANGFSTSKSINIKRDLMMIDEAQDISINEYKLINSLNYGKMNVNLFGDTNQNLSNNGISDWNVLKNVFGTLDYYCFNKNYRNSAEIIEYTNHKCNKNMENIGYESFKVQTIDKRSFAQKYMNDTMKRKAVICANKDKMIANLYEIDPYTIKEVKGLEFDSVYVFDEGLTEKERYVAYTRALDKLTIVL